MSKRLMIQFNGKCNLDHSVFCALVRGGERLGGRIWFICGLMWTWSSLVICSIVPLAACESVLLLLWFDWVLLLYVLFYYVLLVLLFSDTHGWLDLVSLILQQILQSCLKEKARRSWQNGIFWNFWRLCLWLLEGTVAIEISKFRNSTRLMTWIYYWDCHGMEDCFLLVFRSFLFENLEPDSLFHTIVWFLFSFPFSNGFSECSGSFWHQLRCFMKLVLVR